MQDFDLIFYVLGPTTDSIHSLVDRGHICSKIEIEYPGGPSVIEARYTISVELIDSFVNFLDMIYKLHVTSSYQLNDTDDPGKKKERRGTRRRGRRRRRRTYRVAGAGEGSLFPFYQLGKSPSFRLTQ